jgi:uncharacterized phage protein gp47/JayE
MAEIIQANGRPVVDYMARDFDSLLQAMRDQIPAKLPEWTDNANEADFGNVLLELFAQIGDILSYYQDRVANESFLGTAQSRRSIIEHLRLIGYKLATAAPAATNLQVTVPDTFSGKITVTKGDAFATKSQKTKPSARFEYTGDDPLVLDFSSPDVSQFPLPGVKFYVSTDIHAQTKTIMCLDVNTTPPTLTSACLPVEEGRLIKDEIIGQSDGSPNQRFPLAHPALILLPVGPAQGISRDVMLLTQLGPTIDAWTLQESLAFSRANQQDFVIEIDENDQATVIFGDGALGAIPPKGATIRVTFRIGGGLAGNVPAGAIQTILNAPQLALLAAKVTNPAPATGGAEREDIPHAVLHAPGVFRSLKRAVTAADYVALASSFKGVGKVQAASTSWNTVTLYVAPQGGGKVSDVLESNLLAFFEDKRVLGQIVEIQDVDYVPIFVTAELIVQSYYSRDDVTARVKIACAALLNFDNVDFGESIYLSRFYDTIQDVAGVVAVNITEFRRPGQTTAVEPNGRIVLGPNEIPTEVPKTSDPDYESGVKVVITEGGF